MYDKTIILTTDTLLNWAQILQGVFCIGISVAVSRRGAEVEANLARDVNDLICLDAHLGIRRQQQLWLWPHEWGFTESIEPN